MSNVLYNKTGPSTYDVLYINGVALGQLEPTDDGFLVFWPILRGGFWEAHVMLDIANKLDELNAPWKKIVDDYRAGEGSE